VAPDAGYRWPWWPMAGSNASQIDHGMRVPTRVQQPFAPDASGSLGVSDRLIQGVMNSQTGHGGTGPLACHSPEPLEKRLRAKGRRLQIVVTADRVIAIPLKLSRAQPCTIAMASASALIACPRGGLSPAASTGCLSRAPSHPFRDGTLGGWDERQRNGGADRRARSASRAREGDLDQREDSEVFAG
jgi:hypothetical protein